MYISKITLENFMCYGERTIINLEQDITFFVGNNGSGKTAIFKALNKIFGTNSDNKNILKTDFHMNYNKSLNDGINKKMLIEVELSFPEIQNKNTISDNIAIFSHYIFYSTTSKNYIVRLRLESFYDESENDINVDYNKYWIICDDSIEIGVDSPYKLRVNRTDLQHIKYIYIPSTRSINDLTKNVIKRINHLIINNIDYENTKELIGSTNETLNNLILNITGIKNVIEIIKKSWNEVIDKDIEYCSNIMYTALPQDIEILLSNLSLKFGTNIENYLYNIDQLSDGQLSLLYIVLIFVLFELEYKIFNMSIEGFIQKSNNKLTTYVLFVLEEPENHLSPFYLSKLFNILYKYIDEYKIITCLVSTHSPAVINRLKRLDQIRYFRNNRYNDDRKTIIKSLSLPEYNNTGYKYISQAVISHPELYFAKLVILGEGMSENIVIPTLSKLLNFELDPSFVSFIPLGGRHVNYLWKLLNDLEIPFLTLLDLDLGRAHGGTNILKNILEQLKQFEEKEVDIDIDISDTNTPAKLQNLLKQFEKYNIFFSYPLDLDLSMLIAYNQYYISGKCRCNIEDIFGEKHNYFTFAQEIYNSIKDIDDILQKYKYCFKNNSKISSHYMAMQKIIAADKDEIINLCPATIRKLIDVAKNIIEG